MTTMISHADNLTLRAWRRGELAPADADAFETRLFFEPSLADAATIDLQLADAFAAVCERQTGQDPTYALVAEKQLLGAATSTVRRHRGNPWSMLLAAGVGALAVLPFARVTLEAPGALGNVELVSVDVRRGAEDRGLLVEPRAGTQAVVIEFAAPTANAGPYTVSLVAIDSGETVVSVPGLIDVDGLLSLTFARDALMAGDYRVEIAAAGGAPAASALRIDYRP